eukprot:CAMPEP_0197439478 /NCGR_PEP_ID=MMETSP1175-20131217/6212_1 /TAXON_ID=1003142 /ORGANISM="Triceratium dubium, Strain CCMP147" /LENGTH=398 /DNA_ID=CAMNT_0042969403 /DNA_START=25 /DNA_END=1221 /DNA_ORIENTATION=-
MEVTLEGNARCATVFQDGSGESSRRWKQQQPRVCSVFLALATGLALAAVATLSTRSMPLLKYFARNHHAHEGFATISDDSAAFPASAAVASRPSHRRPANMFDCNALPDSECVHFRPTAFFESPDGAGRAYINETLPWRDARSGMPKKSNFLRLVRRNASATEKGGRRSDLVPDDQAYMHLHKNGGTTIEAAMRDFVRHRRKHYSLDDYYWLRAHRMSFEEMRNATSVTMNDIARKQRGGDRDAVAFSFLRHPFRKFLSAIGEVMHQQKMKQCHSKTGRNLLECALGIILESGKGLSYNIHFKPQAIELYDCAGGSDVTVSLLDMSYIGRYVGDGCLGLKKDAPHGRSETKQYFPGEGDPTELLDDDTVRKLCELYRVDVVFFRHIGREIPECVPYHM